MKYVPILVIGCFWIFYFVGIYRRNKGSRKVIQKFPNAFVVDEWTCTKKFIIVTCIINGKSRNFTFMRNNFEWYVDSVSHRERITTPVGNQHEDEHHVEIMSWSEYYAMESAEIDVIHYLLHYPSF